MIFLTLPFVRTKGNTKNRRGETISGSATAPALNRMPAALLKQSKVRLRRRFLASAKPERVRLCPRLIENVLRFLTLRRRGRLLSEIASAADWADACRYCRLQFTRGRKPPPKKRKNPVGTLSDRICKTLRVPRYSISHVSPERSRSSTQRILDVAFTCSTCSATFSS